MSNTEAFLQSGQALMKSLEGLTLCTVLQRTVQRCGETPAYSDGLGRAGAVRTLTWHEFREAALDAAGGLIAHGITAGARVAVMAANRVEHVVSDAAILHAGCIPVPIYVTASPKQVRSITTTCAPAAVIVENADHLARFRPALDELDQITLIVILQDDVSCDDPRAISWQTLISKGAAYRAVNTSECESRWQAVDPMQPATTIFTSGTTGEPKGVVLTHRNILFETHAVLSVNRLHDAGVTVSYLPFAHVAERILSMYLPYTGGGHVRLIPDSVDLLDTLREVRPTRFFGVPRIWEKIQSGISAQLSTNDEQHGAALADAFAVGLHYVESLQFGREPAEIGEEALGRAEQLLAPLRAAVGLDRLVWATTAAAPMPADTLRFFAGLGMCIYDLYGMTETTGTATANTAAAFRLGSVGRPLPGIELQVSDENEILVRGPIVTPGYYGRTSVGADITTDGWLHTGDIGRQDDDGFLYIEGRIKELIITSSGKNIAPSLIEGLVSESEIVSGVLVYGDQRPYVVALVTIDPDIARAAASEFGVPADPFALAQDPRIVTAVQQAIDRANAQVSRPEQVKKFALLPEQWTVDSGDLTPTLKLRRAAISARHADTLERLYHR